MALVTYPLNNIEYSAEDAELFHATRTSGIYANNSFGYDITGADSNIVIGTGIGWIKNSEFSGKVIAQKEAISLDMGLPDPVYPRIDAIVIQFDNNRNETNIVVKKGTAASTPVAPSVVQNESVYELHLYHVRREAGSLYITPSNITDLRLNSSYCGLMADSVTNIDTTAIEKQVSDLIKSLQSEISNVIDGSAYLLRDGSTNMTGNLPMDGHKITGLGRPTEDGDAVNLGFANKNYRGSDWLPSVEEIGAALAGYGYGGSTVSLQEDRVDDDTELANALESVYSKMAGKETKFLYWTGYPAGTSGHGWFGILQKSSENNGSLVAWSAYGAGSTIRKAKYSGSWQPLEWENPPMEDGVEYLTTKRNFGKPVYVTSITFGALPAKSYKDIQLSTSGSKLEVLAFSVIATDTDGKEYPFPFVNDSGALLGYARMGGARTVHLRTHADISDYTGKLILEYTKE